MMPVACRCSTSWTTGMRRTCSPSLPSSRPSAVSPTDPRPCTAPPSLPPSMRPPRVVTQPLPHLSPGFLSPSSPVPDPTPPVSSHPTATAKERESLFPEPNESIIPSATVNMDSIKVLNVGRIDSNLYDLDDYQIPPKVGAYRVYINLTLSLLYIES